MARYATTEDILTCPRCECRFTFREALPNDYNIGWATTCPKCLGMFHDDHFDVEWNEDHGWLCNN